MQEGNISLVLISIIGILASVVVLGILILKIICIHTIWLSGKKPSELDIDIFMNYYRSCKIKGNKRYVNIVADHLEAIEDMLFYDLYNSLYTDCGAFYFCLGFGAPLVCTPLPGLI